MIDLKLTFLKNFSQKNLAVLKNDYCGFGCPKDALVAMAMVPFSHIQKEVGHADTHCFIHVMSSLLQNVY